MRRAKSYTLLFLLAVAAAILIISRMPPRQAESSIRDNALFSYRMKDLAVISVTADHPFFVADVDLDGNDDLLVNERDRLLWYRLSDSTITLEREGRYIGPGTAVLVADANGDGRPEFFVRTQKTNRLELSCHDWFAPAGPSVPLYTLERMLPPQKIEEANPNKLAVLGCLALEDGGPARLFIGINPVRHEKSLRSLTAYDAATGRKLWEFSFAPMTMALAGGTLGGNESRVVLTTTSSRCGIPCEGMVDTLSYVFCLDGLDGRLIWQKQVTGLFGWSWPAIADIDGDGRNEVVVARYLYAADPISRENPSPWIVMGMSGEGTVLSTVSLPNSAKSIRASNLDDDPLPELLVEGTAEEIVILDQALRIRRIRKSPRGDSGETSEIYGVRDLTGDGKPEIVRRLSKDLFILDRDGAPLACRTFPNTDADWQLFALPARYDGKGRIIAALRDSLRVMALEPTPVASRFIAYARHLAVRLAVAAILAVWVVFHVRRMLKRRRERGISLDEAHDELLKAMSAFGHGGSSLKVIDRLKLHLKNWDRIQADGVTREELFAKLREAYVETVVPEINHIVMLARKARIPEGIWNSLRAEAGFASGETNAILATGSEGDAYRREHIAKALGALDAVDGSLAGIRAHLRAIFRTPVAEALERLVARFREEHGARGISFALVSDAAEAADAFIYPVTFDKIFESLLSNAVRATEGRADAEIAAAVQWEGIYCRIDVRDNGCGIPRDDYERVFERHYTTKPEGGGFGLYYAREELAKFGGKIYVLASDAGSGTTMRVVLRKTEKTGGV